MHGFVGGRSLMGGILTLLLGGMVIIVGVSFEEVAGWR
jgi:hypothetical protein